MSINAPEPTQDFGEPDKSEGAYVGVGIYPSAWEIGNPSKYYTGLTIDVELKIFNGLPFSSPSLLTIDKPPQSYIDGFEGYEWWDGATEYISIIGASEELEAHGSESIQAKLLVPKEVKEYPKKWLCWVTYRNEGQLWGNYEEVNGSFVFFPAAFQSDLSNRTQAFTYLTGGHSPQIIVRAAYNKPPESITDGELVYQGYGEQVRLPWKNEKGNIVERQFTQFDFSTYYELNQNEGTKLFYRAWREHTVWDIPDGTWDKIGENKTIYAATTLLLVTMR